MRRQDNMNHSQCLCGSTGDLELLNSILFVWGITVPKATSQLLIKLLSIEMSTS